ncbi:hypothetical protein [Sinomonas flava]|uniref:hypothetical protein n=1 Tax=Sinomonas flava TaxID=496857 RepID=UPI0039A51325
MDDGATVNAASQRGLEGLGEELARRALERAAPDELLTFDLVVEDYRADPAGALTRSSGDPAVGFGLDLAALAPFALAVASAVVPFIADLLRESAAEAAKTGVGEALRRLFHHADTARRGADDPPPLTPEQNAQVFDAATQQGLALGLDRERATLLGHAIVGALAVAPG